MLEKHRQGGREGTRRAGRGARRRVGKARAAGRARRTRVTGRRGIVELWRRGRRASAAEARRSTSFIFFLSTTLRSTRPTSACRDLNRKELLRTAALWERGRVPALAKSILLLPRRSSGAGGRLWLNTPSCTLQDRWKSCSRPPAAAQVPHMRRQAPDLESPPFPFSASSLPSSHLDSCLRRHDRLSSLSPAAYIGSQSAHTASRLGLPSSGVENAGARGRFAS